MKSEYRVFLVGTFDTAEDQAKAYEMWKASVIMVNSDKANRVMADAKADISDLPIFKSVEIRKEEIQIQEDSVSERIC